MQRFCVWNLEGVKRKQKYVKMDRKLKKTGDVDRFLRNVSYKWNKWLMTKTDEVIVGWSDIVV